MVGSLVLEAVVGEFSPPTASPMGMPWDFHEKCRASFEVRVGGPPSLHPDAKPNLAHVLDQTCMGAARTFASSSPLLSGRQKRHCALAVR